MEMVKRSIGLQFEFLILSLFDKNYGDFTYKSSEDVVSKLKNNIDLWSLVGNTSNVEHFKERISGTLSDLFEVGILKCEKKGRTNLYYISDEDTYYNALKKIIEEIDESLDANVINNSGSNIKEKMIQGVDEGTVLIDIETADKGKKIEMFTDEQLKLFAKYVIEFLY